MHVWGSPTDSDNKSGPRIQHPASSIQSDADAPLYLFAFAFAFAAFVAVTFFAVALGLGLGFDLPPPRIPRIQLFSEGGCTEDDARDEASDDDGRDCTVCKGMKVDSVWRWRLRRGEGCFAASFA
jgi:hypothetical protein